MIVAADVAGVIAGAVAVYTLVAVGGTVAVVVGLIATIVAGVACPFLLYEDGKHIWFTALHDKVGLARLEAQPDYQWIQAVAPWFTLPDLAIGGRTVVREALQAGRKTGEVLSRAKLFETAAHSSSREAHQILSDAEQDWRTIKTAQAEAGRRANDYHRMSALAHRESLNLMAKRNAVVATAGGIYAARQYIHESPVLTERAIDKARDKAHEAAEEIYLKAEKLLGANTGSAARTGEVGHLLTPSSLPVRATMNLHMNVAVMRKRTK